MTHNMMVPYSKPHRLLALAPGVGLNTTTEQEFRDLALQARRPLLTVHTLRSHPTNVCPPPLPACTQMLKLAAALNRTLLVPDPACTSTWISKVERLHVITNGDLVRASGLCALPVWKQRSPDWAPSVVLQLPVPSMRVGGSVLAFPRRGGGVGIAPPDELYCMWAHAGMQEANPCVAHAISYAELSRFLDPVLPPDQRAPTERNTLYYQEWATAKVRGCGADARRWSAALGCPPTPSVLARLLCCYSLRAGGG